MSDCIFCKIVNKEIPSYTIYEDDDVKVFLDINPSVPGHTMVIPKQHYDSFQETPPEVLTKVAVVAQKIAPAVLKAVDAEAYNFTNNCGRAAGQIIMHTHFHLMPRRSDDGKKLFGGHEG
ncbi:MAG: HIT family protein, partial [Candidatus Uhrbacteria bacterium]